MLFNLKMEKEGYKQEFYRKNTSALMNILNIVFQIIVILIALAPILVILRFSFNYNIFIFAISLVVSVYLFFIYLVILIGFVRIILIRQQPEGDYSIENNIFIKTLIIYYLRNIIENSFLRFILYSSPMFWVFYYKMLGMKISGFFMMGQDAIILEPWDVEVGRNTLFGAGSITSPHSVEGKKFLIRKVKINDNVTIGARSIVGPGVKIGTGSIIGAMSGVGKGMKIPANELWAGIPAKRIKKLR